MSGIHGEGLEYVPPNLPVILEPYAFSSLLMSAAEVFSKETTGFLIGHGDRQFVQGKVRDCLAIHAAYPVQTAERGRSHVAFGNDTARRRVEGTVKAAGFNIVGGFHSHPDSSSNLSKDDKRFAWDYLKDVGPKLGLEEWLEIVVSIKKVKKPEKTKMLKKVIRKEGDLDVGFYPYHTIPSIEGYLLIDAKTAFKVEMRGNWFDRGQLTEPLLLYSRY